MDYDPSTYTGTAPHYLRGRPPYSAKLLDVLTEELGLDGTGHLLDIGCGPGVLAVQLAPAFERVTGVDPDPGMLAEARAHAERSGVEVDWHQARAEELPDVGPVRVATFGQSFHWTDRERVAEDLYDRIQPDGALVLVVHDIDAGPAPEGPGHPRIPLDDVYALIREYLGPTRRAGRGDHVAHDDEYEDALGRTRFGRPHQVHAPGRPDLVRTIDEVISTFLSMSYAAPHLFGDRLDAFVADLRALLEAATPTGRFWEWPGDTAILIADRPG